MVQTQRGEESSLNSNCQGLSLLAVVMLVLNSSWKRTFAKFEGWFPALFSSAALAGQLVPVLGRCCGTNPKLLLRKMDCGAESSFSILQMLLTFF